MQGGARSGWSRQCARRVVAAAAALVIACTLFVAHSAFGAEDEPFSSILPRGKWLEDRGPSDPRPHDDVLIGNGLLGSDYFDFKNRLWADNNISFGGYFSANAQWGSEGGPAHSISEFLALMTWEPVRTGNSAGRLVFGFAHDVTFGHPITRAFADNQQLVETPNDLDTDPDLVFSTLGLLHWEHEFRTGPGSGWGFRAGQLYAPAYFGVGRYLDDDRRHFMARPLATAAGAQWVGANDIGLGLNWIGWKAPFYVSAAIMDGKANRQYPDFSSLADGQMLYLGEVGMETDLDGPNETAVRLTFGHLDVQDGEEPSKGPGQTLMLTADRRFGGSWALAGRWSRSFTRLSSEYGELVQLGLMWLTPLGRPQDIAGVGIFAGDPSDESRATESGGELFYRVQLTQAINLMPDIQYWHRNDQGAAAVNTWVWGVRLNYDF